MIQKTSISAIIIAKNEAVRIGTCLDALSFADEVLVADNGSADDTAEVARAHGARVVRFNAEDFAKLRNEALSRVTGEWVLYIDADEIVGKTLARSIRRTAESWKPGDPSHYLLSRVNYYLGKRWPGNEWMPRLFRRESLIRWEGELHESPKTEGEVGRLEGELIHDTHRSLSEMVEKTNDWSETEADLRLAAHHPRVSWWRLLRVMATGFWRSFIRQEGWRAGDVGWIESMYQAFSLFITYAKLWEKQNGKHADHP